jgi:DNA-binding NarL/FixJ family response regulator
MSRRVFVIWAHPLFYETLRALLNHSSIEIAGASSNYQTARADIETQRPDIVIIEELDNESVSQSETFRLLDESQWAVKIVRLNLQDNNLLLYQREQKTIGQVDDLLKLILPD